MNLALEYAIRKDVLLDMIKFPLSIMVEHRKLDNKIVITVTQKKDEYCIKHWYVSSCSDQYLPSFREYYVSNLFSNHNVVLPNYYLLRFSETSLRGKKYYENFSGLMADEEYKNYVKTFYNSETNNTKRMNWLWDAFVNANASSIKKYDIFANAYQRYSNINEYMDGQRSIIREKSPKLWSNWLMWRKYLLDFDVKVASEILFYKFYKLTNENYDKDIILSTGW